MLKTCMTKKLEEMKNGGYTLFSDKVRKTLIAMGLSLLSIGTLSQVANAQVAYDVKFKSGEFGGENDAKTIRYQINLSDDTNDLEGIYEANGVTKITPIVGKVEGREAMVVIEVPKDTATIIVKNDAALYQEPGSSATIDLTDEEIVEDHDGPAVVPDTLVRYNSGDDSYIQAKFTDDTKIYRVVDEDDHERAIIKEKDKDNEVLLKYVLDNDYDESAEPADLKDQSFTIYDILGNSTTVSLTDDVKVNIEYNTRNISGTQMAFKVNRTFEEVITPAYDQEPAVTEEYTLSRIITGSGQEITINTEIDNCVYTNIPAGTTKLFLTYESENHETQTITVPLIVDKDAPVVIAYKSTKKADTEYEVMQSEAQDALARAYFNRDKKKGIVEVKDIKSGIRTIKTLKGKAGSYKEENTVYESTTLDKSVLCVFDVTNETTAVKVYDGVGNTIEIKLGEVREQEAVTVATIVEDGADGYKLVAQDVKVGLGKITRTGEQDDLANFTSEAGLTIGEGENAKHYAQYTLERFEMAVNAKGDPIICVYDAIGNKREVSFDEFAYMCHYATFNTTGSLSINVQEVRGISKIEVQMTDFLGGEEPVIKQKPSSERLQVTAEELDKTAEDYEDKLIIINDWKEYDDSVIAWEEWNEQHRHVYTLETFRGTQPKEVKKTYQIPEGIVEKVIVYNDNNSNEINNELINISDVTPEDRIKTSLDSIKKDSNGNQIVGAQIGAKFGIKSVKYDDDCVVRFYDELPTSLYVNCLITKGDQSVFTKAVVTDALGDTLTIEGEKVTFSYNNQEIKINQ